MSVEVVIFFGFVLIGGYLGALAFAANFLELYAPSLGLLALLSFGIVLGLLLVKLQTQLERYMIARHLRKNPSSRWGVVTPTGYVPRPISVHPGSSHNRTT